VAFRSIGQGEGLFRRLDVRWPFAFCSFCIRPLETIGSLIARASISPLWRVEGRGRAPGVPFEPVGPGPNIRGRRGGDPSLVRIRIRGPTA
jgi:hypothetical protein